MYFLSGSHDFPGPFRFRTRASPPCRLRATAQGWGARPFIFFSLPRELAESLTRATQPGLVSPDGTSGDQAQRYHPASLRLIRVRGKSSPCRLLLCQADRSEVMRSLSPCAGLPAPAEKYCQYNGLFECSRVQIVTVLLPRWLPTMLRRTGSPPFGLWSQAFHDCVGIRKAHKAVSQMRDGRVGDHRRSSLRYSYNAGSAGLVNGTGYLTRSLGVIFGVKHPTFLREMSSPLLYLGEFREGSSRQFWVHS
jgi:hypothetical protein